MGKLTFNQVKDKWWTVRRHRSTQPRQTAGLRPRRSLRSKPNHLYVLFSIPKPLIDDATQSLLSSVPSTNPPLPQINPSLNSSLSSIPTKLIPNSITSSSKPPQNLVATFPASKPNTMRKSNTSTSVVVAWYTTDQTTKKVYRRDRFSMASKPFNSPLITQKRVGPISATIVLCEAILPLPAQLPSKLLLVVSSRVRSCFMSQACSETFQVPLLYLQEETKETF